MAVLNIALLAALLPAVLAIPQHGAIYSHHGSHRGSKPPGGWPHPTGGPFHSGQAPFPPKASGGAPFPAGNSTAGGATATGTGIGMVTIKSTINLIPVPLTSSTPVVGQSPATTGAVAGGPGGPGQSGSPGSPSGVPGGSGLAGGTCGPATVTVTTANTVTVTVQASASPSLIESPQSSAPVQSSVAPYPMYNSSIPFGSTGTGTGIGSIFTSYVAPTPSTSSSASSSASLKIVQEASDGQVFVPATPIEAGTAATTSSLVAVNADYHQPGRPGPSSWPAAPEQPSPVVPAPASSSSVSSAVPFPVDSPVSTALSAPASSSSTSTSGSSGSTGVKARGLLYSYNNQQLSPAESLAQANAAVNGAVGWMANWDSSPSTGSGQATGSGNVPYVAQLWGTDATHLAAWKTNAVTSWLMSFNEPDRCDDGGSCLNPTEAAAAHTANIAPLRTGGTKVTTPCTQNNVGSPGIGSDWMGNFTAQFPPNSFDAICLHWYGPGTQEGLNGADNPQSLAATVAAYQDIQKANGIAELWITEGGPEDASSDMITTFLAWLDDESNGVDRYLWNGLNSPTSVVAVGSDSTYMST